MELEELQDELGELDDSISSAKGGGATSFELAAPVPFLGQG